MNFENEVLNTTGKTLVDFYTNHCPPCRLMSPIVDELAQDYKVVKVNANEVDGAVLASQFQVRAVPTFIIFEDGKEVDRLVGFQKKDKLAKLLKD